VRPSRSHPEAENSPGVKPGLFSFPRLIYFVDIHLDRIETS
jgi:hypothetical protein